MLAIDNMLHSDSMVVTSAPGAISPDARPSPSEKISHKPGESAKDSAAKATEEAVPLFVDCWQGRAGADRILLIVHGLGEHGGRYRHVAEHLNDQFERFYAMDQRGHGRSGGLRGYVPTFDHLVEDIKRVMREIQERERGKKIYVLGHSFGGLVVLRMLLNERTVPFEGAVISAPVLGLATKVPVIKQFLGELLSVAVSKFQMRNEINPSLLSHDPMVVEGYVNDRLVHNRITPGLYAEMMSTMDWVQRQFGPLACPSLFIVPGDDRLVDSSITMTFATNLKGAGKQINTYPGFYHEALNEIGKEAVFEDIKRWLSTPPFQKKS